MKRLLLVLILFGFSISKAKPIDIPEYLRQIPPLDWTYCGIGYQDNKENRKYLKNYGLSKFNFVDLTNLNAITIDSLSHFIQKKFNLLDYYIDVDIDGWIFGVEFEFFVTDKFTFSLFVCLENKIKSSCNLTSNYDGNISKYKEIVENNYRMIKDLHFKFTTQFKQKIKKK